MSAFSIFNSLAEKGSSSTELLEKVEIYTNLIGMTNATNIWNFDEEGMEENLDSFLKDKSVRKIILKDSNANEIIERVSPFEIDIPEEKLIIIEQEIVKDDELVGYLAIDFTSYYIDKVILNKVILSIAVTLGIMIMMFLTIVITGIKVTKPLVTMTKLLEKISNKDLTEALEIKTNDEISIVGNGINGVVDILKNSIGEISVKASNLTAISENLAAAAEEGFSTSETMKSQLNDMREKVEDSVQEVDQINLKMNKQEVFLKENEENSVKTYEKTSITIENVKKGVEIVNDVAKEMKEVNNQVTLSTETIKKLASLLEKVDGFSKVITDISSQTNLLALNAAIEAARAGDAGRGFAVVANEVKTLAEESNKAAEEIGNMVTDVKGETTKSVEIMNETYKKVSENSQKLNQTTGVLKTIQSDSVEMGEMINQISTSLDLQNKNQNEIMSEMENIVVTLTNNNEEVKKVVTGVEEHISAGQLVAEASSEVVDNAEQLSVVVAEFIVESEDIDKVKDIKEL